MEKKKVLKIGGIILLSIFVLFIVVPYVAYLLLNPNTGSDDYYSPSVMKDMSYESNHGVDTLLSDKFSSKSMGQDSGSSTTEESTVPNQDKSIIKTGSLRILADDIDDTVSDIELIANKYEAESQNTYDNGKGKDRRVNVVYKVKVSSFENFFNELKDMDVEFDYTSSGITDVTSEVIDLEARLKTYRNTEAQLLEIQKTANNVTDTMTVYRELNTIRYQIESIESQLKYYSNRTDYSTVTVTISQNNAGAMIEDDTWKPLGVLKNALRALVAVVKGLGSLIIWLAVFGVPIILVILLVKYIVRKAKK